MNIRRYSVLLLLLCGLLLGSCSRKGVTMPTHRKRKHCDCPTFSMRETPQAAEETYLCATL